MTYYLTNILVYAGVDIIACLALNLQFGVSGIVNFSFIVFQAAGAYTAAVLSLPPDSANGGFQNYVLGAQLPFPLPWIAGAVVGGLLSIPVGLVVLRRLRPDYQAIAMLVLSVIVNLVITNARPFLNGAAGLSLIPQPLSDQFNPYSAGYLWGYVGAAAVCALLVFLVAQRIVKSPYGRTLRAMREHELAVTALGKNPVVLKMTIFIVGGVMAGLSGAVLVQFITIWAPSTWLYPETLILFAAVIVGGRGNNIGALLGAVLVPVGFEEATRYLPQFGPPGLVPAFEWVAIGMLIIGFLWFRPKGVVPERPGRIPAASAPGGGRLAEDSGAR
ncbi:MAG TPA: branched-chain amino acid ABC transporter permease [Candidatus Dormibacteraeota bacterium]|jgi:branched-chain amino acid transport system permease protein|nr:branched-chain amino acid ABC transporter permease [Candidatus Dormibacteraeota bacterium]